MACNPTNPCQRSTCTKCNSNAAPGIVPIDSSTIIYHLKPGQVSKLICLGLANGVSLETILERIDAQLCAKSAPDPGKLNLTCFLQGKPAPASLGALIEQITGAICSLRTATDINALIQNLLSNSSFIQQLGVLIANNPSFVSTLLNNQSFLTGLATNKTFIDALVANSYFIDQVGTALVNNAHFISSLVTKITTDPALKEQFCCDSGGESPCKSMIVGGVAQIVCNCTPPTNIQLNGAGTGAPNTDLTYTITYAGNPGSVAWSISNGTIQAQTDTSVTVRFTSTGTLSASLTGCDGIKYPITKQVQIGPGCTEIAGLKINGNTSPIPGTSETYTKSVTAGSPTTYSWTISGGIITGSASSDTVTVTWTGSGIPGVLNLAVNDCSGSAKNATLSVAPQQGGTEQIGTLSLSCRTLGSCNDNATCAVRYIINITGLTANLGYSGDLQKTGGNGASLTLDNFTQSGTTATAILTYNEVNGLASYAGIFKLKQGTTVVGTQDINLVHSTSYSQISSCNQPPTVQPTNSQGQFTVSFDNTGLTAPYTYTVTDDQGNVKDSGTL